MSEFFEQLEIFSARVFRNWNLDTTCKWTGPWEHGAPRGAVIHYTRGQKLSRTVTWFMDARRGSKSSAHVVVSPIRIDSLDPFLADLPLIQALPVTVLQCVPPTAAAWHATWTNGYLYGIENVNAGLLAPRADGSYRYGGRNQHCYAMFRAPVWAFGKAWEPYTLGQVRANIIVLRELQELYGTLRRPWVLGHEHVQGKRTPRSSKKDKRDPGPVFPLPAVWEGLFDAPKTPLEDLSGLAHFGLDNKYHLTWRDGVLFDAWPGHSPEACWEIFETNLKHWRDEEDWSDDEVLPAALGLLGYDLGGPLEDNLWIFRKMMDLPGDPSRITHAVKQNVISRLYDRGFMSEVA